MLIYGHLDHQERSEVELIKIPQVFIEQKCIWKMLHVKVVTISMG